MKVNDLPEGFERVWVLFFREKNKLNVIFVSSNPKIAMDFMTQELSGNICNDMLNSYFIEERIIFLTSKSEKGELSYVILDPKIEELLHRADQCDLDGSRFIQPIIKTLGKNKLKKLSEEERIFLFGYNPMEK